MLVPVQAFLSIHVTWIERAKRTLLVRLKAILLAFLFPFSFFLPPLLLPLPSLFCLELLLPYLLLPICFVFVLGLLPDDILRRFILGAGAPGRDDDEQPHRESACRS